MRTKNQPRRSSRAAIGHLDQLLDEALRETFPASDPVAIAIDIDFSRHRTIEVEIDTPSRRGRKP